MSDEMKRYDVVINGAFYTEGSSDPWRGGTYSAVVSAEGAAEAVIEVLVGFGRNGRIESEAGDCDWTVFEDERELMIRVSPVPEAE